MSDRPPQPWPAVAWLFLVVSVIETLAMGHLFAFLPLLLRDMGVPDPQIAQRVGLYTSLMFFVGLPLIPFWGVWADRYGRRLVIARSAYVEAVVFAVLVFAATPTQLALGVMLVGLQLGNTGVMLSALRQITPPERVGFALSLVQLGSPIGQAVGPALGGWMMDHTPVTLRGLFAIDAVLSVFAGLFLTFGYRETKPEKPADGSVAAQAAGSVRTVFRSPVARTLFGTMILFLIARGMINPLLALVVQRVHPESAGLPSAIGTVAGTAATLGALAAPFAGLAGDRIGHRAVLGAGTLLGAFALGAMGSARTVGELATLSALLGAAGATVISMVYALLALRLPAEQRSGVLNLAFVPFYIGGIVGPNLAAAIGGGSLDPVFPAAAGAALLAGLCVLSPSLGAGTGKPAPDPTATA